MVVKNKISVFKYVNIKAYKAYKLADVNNESLKRSNRNVDSTFRARAKN